MVVCVTCGTRLKTATSRGAAPTADPVEAAGRDLYGLPRATPLCAGCLQTVRDAGAAVFQAEGLMLCPICRNQLERAWQRADAPQQGRGEATFGFLPPEEPPTHSTPPRRARPS